MSHSMTIDGVAIEIDDFNIADFGKSIVDLAADYVNKHPTATAATVFNAYITRFASGINDLTEEAKLKRIRSIKVLQTIAEIAQKRAGNADTLKKTSGDYVYQLIQDMRDAEAAKETAKDGSGPAPALGTKTAPYQPYVTDATP